MILVLTALAGPVAFTVPDALWTIPADDRLPHAIAVDLADPILYPSFAEAAAHAPSPPWLAADALDLATRRADDAVLAGLSSRPDRDALVHDLLKAAVARWPAGPTEAPHPVIVWAATAAELGDGRQVPQVPFGALEPASSAAAAFRDSAAGRPVAPWSAEVKLRKAFARDRWLARPVEGPLSQGLGELLAAHPELAARLEAERTLVLGLTGDARAPDPLGAPDGPAVVLPALQPVHGPVAAVDSALGLDLLAAGVRGGPGTPADGGLRARREWAAEAWIRWDGMEASLAVGSGARQRAEEQWARALTLERPDPVRRVTPSEAPVLTGAWAEPLPTHLSRSASVSAWAASTPWAQASGASALSALAADQRAAAALASASLGVPLEPTRPLASGVLAGVGALRGAALLADPQDVRSLQPIVWSADGRVTCWGVLGVRILPVEVTCAGCDRPVARSLLVPVWASVRLDRPISDEDLRALSDASPRRSQLRAALDPPAPPALGCDNAPLHVNSLAMLLLLRVRRRS